MRLVDLLADPSREVESIEVLEPLLGKNQPPDEVHQEHGRRGDGELFANKEGRLIP